MVGHDALMSNALARIKQLEAALCAWWTLPLLVCPTRAPDACQVGVEEPGQCVSEGKNSIIPSIDPCTIYLYT